MSNRFLYEYVEGKPNEQVRNKFAHRVADQKVQGFDKPSGLLFTKRRDVEAYASMFYFPQFEMHNHIREVGSIRGYKGPCGVDWIWIDLDRKDDIYAAFIDAAKILHRLDAFGFHPEQYASVFFSGSKGAHVLLSAARCGISERTVTEKIPSIVHSIVHNICDPIGIQYDNRYFYTSIVRLPMSLHTASGYYKVPVRMDLAMGCMTTRHAKRIVDACHLASKGLPSSMPRELLYEAIDIGKELLSPKGASIYSSFENRGFKALSRAHTSDEGRLFYIPEKDRNETMYSQALRLFKSNLAESHVWEIMDMIYDHVDLTDFEDKEYHDLMRSAHRRAEEYKRKKQ